MLTNKYAEGYPAKQYYGGCQNVDEVENIAIERAKKLFGAEHVNVQPTRARRRTSRSISRCSSRATPWCGITPFGVTRLLLKTVTSRWIRMPSVPIGRAPGRVLRQQADSPPL